MPARPRQAGAPALSPTRWCRRRTGTARPRSRAFPARPRTPALTSSDPNATREPHREPTKTTGRTGEEHHEADVHALWRVECCQLGLQAANAPREPQQEESRCQEHEQSGCHDELRQPRHRPDLPRLGREEDHQQEEEEERESAHEHRERRGEQAHEPADRPLEDRDRAESQHEVDETEERRVADERDDRAGPLPPEEEGARRETARTRSLPHATSRGIERKPCPRARLRIATCPARSRSAARTPRWARSRNRSQRVQDLEHERRSRGVAAPSRGPSGRVDRGRTSEGLPVGGRSSSPIRSSSAIAAIEPQASPDERRVRPSSFGVGGSA